MAIGCNDGEVYIRLIDYKDDGSATLKKHCTVSETNQKPTMIPAEWIECMAYNPDCSVLAVGSHDNFVYLYNKEKKYKYTGKLKGHSSFITCLDWSQDGSYMRTNCGAYELLFWTTSDKK